jgi:hypothetical protein
MATRTPLNSSLILLGSRIGGEKSRYHSLSQTEVTMTVVVAMTLVLVFVASRPKDGWTLRRYLGFILVSVGALLWSGIFDSLGSTRSVVTDATLYRHVLRVSSLGAVVSLCGLVAAFWCPQRTLKLATMMIGVVSTTLCAINVLTPY